VSVGSVNLLLAAMDLKLVQLLRGAMNAGGGARGIVHPTPRIEPRPVHHPDPRIEPRKTITPTPRFELRRVHRPEPKFESYQSLAPEQPKGSPCSKVLPPPWKQPLTTLPVEPRPVVKKVEFAPDIVSKGSLIDFFI